MGLLKINCVKTQEAFESLEAEWRALEPRMLPVPFTSYDWNIAWWKHLHLERKSVRDSLFVITFRDEHGALRGVAPMMLTHRPAAGPLRLAQLQFFGADQNITEMRGIAAAVDDMATQYGALLEYLHENREWDWMKLTGVPAATMSKENVAAVLPSVCWTRDLFNFYLVLKPTWDEFKSGLSRNIKESLRKCNNAPKRDGLNFTFNVVTDVRQVRGALNEFFRLHSMRSQLADTIAHPDVFAETNARDFLIEVCERFAARDALRIFQLRNAGQVIASRIGLVSGDSVYFYYSGYDTSYSKYSVMTTTVAEGIKYCIEAGYKTVNLSTGRDVSKERWSPEETLYLEGEIVGARPLAGMKHAAFRGLGDVLRRSLARTRLWALIARRPQ